MILALCVKAERNYHDNARTLENIIFPDTKEGIALKEEAYNELAEMKRVIDALDHARLAADLMNATVPYSLLGFECSMQLASSIFTAMCSFFGYLCALKTNGRPNIF